MHGSVWDSHSQSHDLAHSHEHAHDHTDGHKHGPKQETSLSAACGCGAAAPVVASQSFFGLALRFLIALRENVRAAVVSVVLLALASGLFVLAAPTLAVRAALAGCVALTGFPALAETSVRVFQSRGRDVDVDVLMTLAAVVCVATGAVFEGALLTTLYAVSHAAEHSVAARACEALDALRDLAPSEALKLSSPEDSRTPQVVPVADVQVGDFLLVRTGEIVPCDGNVVSGTAFVSVQHLTGEPSPRSISAGQHTPAGSRTVDAPLVVQVTQIGAESALARISRLVTAAQENRPRITRFFDQFGRLYTRTVLSAAVCIAIALPTIARVFFPSTEFMTYSGHSGSVKRALGFLVAASPCALVIGAPVAYLAALSSCARRGILVKSGAQSLEAASKASDIVFDKTGTLTTGRLSLTSTSVVPTEASAAREGSRGIDYKYLDSLVEVDASQLGVVISAAASLERGAVHPVATAILKKAESMQLLLPAVSDCRVVAGQGVEGVVVVREDGGDTSIVRGRIGRPSYIMDAFESSWLAHVSNEAAAHGETITMFEFGSQKFLLRLRDEVRKESRYAVDQLRKRGLRVNVLTGDAAGAARLVSDAVGSGIEAVANATPKDKLDYISGLNRDASERNGGVIMVGDGVNDAAALAAALVGVSIGLSSATAVHAADVVLVSEDLNDVDWFVGKAQMTQRVVRENVAIALGLMLLAIIASISGAVPLWLAVTLHEGGTILVGLNGLRLLGK